MGLPAARLNDLCTGHGGYSPRPTTEGSEDVFINNRQAHREGDSLASHCTRYCHSGKTNDGSKSVFVNGKKAVRVGDSVDCGSSIMTGSDSVFIGD